MGSGCLGVGISWRALVMVMLLSVLDLEMLLRSIALL